MAASLSLLLTPAFGAYIHARNWATLGDTKKSGRSWLWMWGLLVATALTLLAGGFGYPYLGVSAWGLILWYFISGKPQVRRVRELRAYERKGWFLPVIAAIALVPVLVGIFTAIGERNSNGLGAVSGATSAAGANGEQMPSLGTEFTNGPVSVVVSDVSTQRSVGSRFLRQDAVTGGAFVVVKWTYRNIGEKPIGMFEIPDLKLVSPSGTVYSPDVGATAIHASANGSEEKVISDLNPGLQVTAFEVFEVSEAAFSIGEWKVRVDGDRDIDVRLQAPSTASDPKAVSSSIGANVQSTVDTHPQTKQIDDNGTGAAPIATRYGNLTADEDGVLLFRGQRVDPSVLYTESAGYSPVAKFEIDASDVILFVQGGGNSCPGNFAYVTVNSDGIRATKNFGTCYDENTDPVQRGREIAFSMPNLGGNGESEFIYRDGVVLKNGEEID